MSTAKDGKILPAGQESGWMDKKTFASWVEQFLEWRKSRNILNKLAPDAPFLLFIDSHTSRENSKVLEQLSLANVELVTFPSHTSHLLQPLDVGVFLHFKEFFRKWRCKFRSWQIKGDDDNPLSEKSVARYKLIRAALAALEQSMVTEYIVHGFNKAGLYPKDKERPLSNPKIVQCEVVVIPIRKRGVLPMEGAIVTSQVVIERVKESEKKRALEKKNQFEIFIFFLTHNILGL